ncbi:uncharacterized protein PSFLO_06145 [Pseudozyma flocculosa]|uniref:Uncharacterized protein n=1 Tax=Pseudozyma flocculosa TaxID=84751 RepID=A0A5C3F881_9BASI|nr:uncharacterized protein PSFLO_06145 [Pseudozyma flocculosa]
MVVIVAVVAVTTARVAPMATEDARPASRRGWRWGQLARPDLSDGRGAQPCPSLAWSGLPAIGRLGPTLVQLGSENPAAAPKMPSINIARASGPSGRRRCGKQFEIDTHGRSAAKPCPIRPGAD